MPRICNIISASLIIMMALLTAQCSREKSLSYEEIYKKEINGEDKMISKAERNTINHVSEKYRDWTKSNLDKSLAFSRNITTLSFKYISMRESLDVPPLTKNVDFPESVKNIDKALRDSIKQYFLENVYCVRIMIGHGESLYLVEGREIKPGLRAILDWDEQPNCIYLGMTQKVDANTYEITEGKYVVCIAIPIYYSDEYTGDISFDYYKIGHE